MALKTLMLRKRIDNKRKEFVELGKKDADFDKRSAELEAAIEEVETEEQRDAVSEAIDTFDSEKAAHEQAKAELDEEIRKLEAELEKLEAAQPTGEVKEERKEIKVMETRKFFGLSNQERDMFFARDDVKNFLGEVRSCIKEKRAMTNVGLTIPQVMLGIIRENIMEYSKLYKHVAVKPVAGEGREVIMGTVPEGVWTDCCANLNELDLSFYDVEVGCWKVGGYFAVCNANIEDSDLDLASEILTAIGQAIGYALDKAILYGTGTRMPLGVVTRLLQTEAPADYPATARPWADLHSSNFVDIEGGTTGVHLFEELALGLAKAKGVYSRGSKIWCMNEKTYAYLTAAAMGVDAAGAIVSGVNGTMPALGGVIEVLNFIPDNVIIAGYFDLYLLAERAGTKFATSEHVKFLQDQTVMRGTARYDGKPTIAEGFIVVGIGVVPTANMTFAPDNANA